MKINWYIVNEKLMAMKSGKKTDEWIEEWNKWVDVSRTIAGCIKWEKYEEETARLGEKQAENQGNPAPTQVVHADMG